MSLAEAHEQKNWGNQFNSPWTEPVKNRLRQLWASEVLCAEIARRLRNEFGFPVSEQSVRNRAFKLGLPSRQYFVWTLPMRTRLTALWAEGPSAREIAHTMSREFGTALTRNAILGAVNRIKLPARKVPLSTEQRAQRAIEKRHAWEARNRDRLNAKARAYQARIRQRAVASSIEDELIPLAQRKAIFDLASHDCRWPVGEPQSDSFFFCGAAVEQDRPYCASHCKRAYVEIRPR